MDEERLKKFKNLNDWKVYYENLYKKTNKEIYKKKSLEFVDSMCKVFINRFDSELNPGAWLEERKKFEKILNEPGSYLSDKPEEKEKVMKFLKKSFEENKIKEEYAKFINLPLQMKKEILEERAKDFEEDRLKHRP